MTQPIRRSIPALMLSALALAAASAHAAGLIEVSYLKPEQFRDAGWGEFERDKTMKSLSTFLKSLATKLPDGQVLQLQVTDIDLAGTLRPARGNEIRVLRGGADWPQISLHYELRQGPTLLRSGDALVSDMNYLEQPRFREADPGDLPYEKRMLQKWFESLLAAAPPAP